MQSVVLTLWRVALVGLSGIAIPAVAEERPLPPADAYWSFGLENDLWGSGEDRHYTHGTKIVYLPPDPPPNRLKTFMRRFPCFPCRNATGIQYVFGQNMFTPDDISRQDLVRDDRPYAGWLYVGAELVAPRTLRPDFRQVDVIEIDIGVVGPVSLAEGTQKLIHDALETEDPQGWDHQLKNEPGLIVTYTRKWQHFGEMGIRGQLERDVSPHVVGALGNIYTYGGGGLLFRVGKGLRNDGGPETVRPSFPGFAYFSPASPRAWYLFSGIEARVMLRNIFLDGNTFRDSHSVDKKPLVVDLQLGFAVTVGRFRIALANVFRSKEFDGQGDIDEYGVITLSFRR